MDIQREIQISKYQPVAFIADSEMNELYRQMTKHWRLDGEESCSVFAASLFDNLGRVHGIRSERARRRPLT